MADRPLTPEPEAEAQRLYRLLKQACDDDLLQMARLLASKPNHQLLGATEFELSERGLQSGAQAGATALGERKKGGPRAPAPPAPAAAKPPSGSAGKSGPPGVSSVRLTCSGLITTAATAATGSAPSLRCSA
jgi:hypothetical protein